MAWGEGYTAIASRAVRSRITSLGPSRLINCFFLRSRNRRVTVSREAPIRIAISSWINHDREKPPRTGGKKRKGGIVRRHMPATSIMARDKAQKHRFEGCASRGKHSIIAFPSKAIFTCVTAFDQRAIMTIEARAPGRVFPANPKFSTADPEDKGPTISDSRGTIIPLWRGDGRANRWRRSRPKRPTALQYLGPD